MNYIENNDKKSYCSICKEQILEDKMDIAKMQFNDIYNKYVLREGAQKFLEYLKKTDFFEAPASAKFHSAYAGGLCAHSVNVYNRAVKALTQEYGEDFQGKFTMENIAVAALLHDVCKADFYKEEIRNVKENGEWVPKKYYTVDDKLPYGHGEKSVYIISAFMKLTRNEAMAINWHMGGFDLRVKGGFFNLSDVFYEYPFALFIHLADIQATYLDEEEFVK